MKKIISSLLVFTMLFSCSITALAAETPGVESAPTDFDVRAVSFTDDYLTGGLSGGLIMPMSTYVPSTFWDLEDDNYDATLTLVGSAWLYTNYYFYGNSDGKLNVTYTIYSNTGRPTQMKVGLYNLNQGKIVAEWTSSGSTLTGITESFNFINLNADHKYAVAFTAVYDGLSKDTVSGTATIRH